MRKSFGLKVGLLGLLALPVLALAACGGEDRPDVDVEGGSGSGTASGSASGSATGEPAGPGVVEAKPANATQVDVTLREWELFPSTTSVKAGQIYFLVENKGPDDPHEFVIIKTELAPGALPTTEGKVPEDKVDLLDEIEPFTPGSKASLAINLTAGKYVLICNIAEVEDGKLESHYQLGMRAGFTVTN